jgi:hypothetical protein
MASSGVWWTATFVAVALVVLVCDGQSNMKVTLVPVRGTYMSSRFGSGSVYDQAQNKILFYGGASGMIGMGTETNEMVSWLLCG